ncbi:hypothetical protein J1N10_10960 [Carboxylicivirga sp. A043]|uniref:hypothetical protein n=1 Tax=Carboxylicivirga litoralis TaxID=2816963 RepID=UPI0021CB1F8F|nr:hypothetical protein [Carboxylicivirga sp. A043]MCU4156500.1 hypothetical protein [Carboxylicivirga sp. A043]
MKTLKSIFAVSLFIVGLSLTSCGSDDKYIAPDGSPENPIYTEKPAHLPEGDAVQPLPPEIAPK